MNGKHRDSKLPGPFNLPVAIKSGNKVQISLCNYDDDDDEEDEEEKELTKPTLKNLKPAESDAKKPTTGLLSILPPPKANRFMSSSSAKASNEETKPGGSTVPSFLIPRTLKKTVSLAPVADDEDEEESEIMKRAKRLRQDPPIHFESTQNYDDDPEPEFKDDADEEEAKESKISKMATYSHAKLELDSDALQKLCGGNKKRHDVPFEITDIKANDIVGDNRSELMKQITNEYKPPSNRDYFAGGGRKKHQITYLAHVAKERDQELKNTWAQGKFNKQQARQKYGF